MSKGNTSFGNDVLYKWLITIYFINCIHKFVSDFLFYFNTNFVWDEFARWSNELIETRNRYSRLGWKRMYN